MTSRRRVVVLPEFFDQLDEFLPAERTATGRPSTADFALHDLTAIIDTLADDYGGSTLSVPGTETRALVTAGMTVSYVAIYVRLRADDTVEVLSLDLDER
ncbi:MAG: hypothetical protein GY698_00375 [Actinomycetia bacterium]|nr:hypothetical protein [Actinomycetes bacterium]